MYEFTNSLTQCEDVEGAILSPYAGHDVVRPVYKEAGLSPAKI